VFTKQTMLKLLFLVNISLINVILNLL